MHTYLTYRDLKASAKSAVEADKQVAVAADKAARAVDGETIGLFRKYGLPLPERLAGKAWLP